MRVLFGTFLCAFLCTAGFADDLTIGGGLQLGSNYLDFEVGSTSIYTPAPGTGTFQVTSVSSGSAFGNAGVTTSELGNIQSLNEGAGPVSLPFPFITFAGLGGATTYLTATYIPAGASAGAFTLSDTSNGAEAVFEVEGYVGTNTSELFTAEFNMFFPGYDDAMLFSNLPQDTTYCANIDVSSTTYPTPTLCNPLAPAAPEPGSWTLLGLGLAGTFVGYRLIRWGVRP